MNKTLKVSWKDLPLKNKTPVLTYCRRLIEEGVDSTTRLEVLYDDKDDIRVFARSIGDAAKLTVQENSKEGPRFVKYTPFPSL